MHYNPIAGTDEDLTDYRGSIVHLTPGTTYEIQLALTGTTTTARLTARTWSEVFPVGETIRLGNRGTPLKIAESGVSGAYRLYDGRGATIDIRHQEDACITLSASYVILRGLTLKVRGPRTAHPRGPSAPLRSRAGTISSSRTATSPTGAGLIRDRLREGLRRGYLLTQCRAGTPHHPALQAA